MKHLIFKSLLISNFKGIKALEVQFGSITNISGDNATGKSTIFDAITWCLFGKNSQDAKDFGIKNTKDKSLNRADHVVELNMMVDGVNTVARRIFKEKWTKRRGSEEADFTGHETLFFWNDTPCSAGEYQKKVSEIMPEDLFKQLTNPLYFNTIKWTDRRDTLIKMSDVTNEKVINGTTAFRQLFDKLNGTKTLEDYKKELVYEKAGLKKQLLDIPARIDELIRSNPQTKDWKSIEAEIVQKQAAIKEIDKQVEEISASFEKEVEVVKIKQREVMDATRQMGEMLREISKQSYADAEAANKDILKAQSALRIARNDLIVWTSTEETHKKYLKKAGEDIQIWREKFVVENARTFDFDRDSCACPTCKRKFDESVIEEKELEMLINFQEDQSKNIADIRAKGKSISEDLDRYNTKLLECNAVITNLKKIESDLLWSETATLAEPTPINPESFPEYMRLKAISEQIIEVKSIDLTEQKEAKVILVEGIDSLKEMLNERAQIQKNNARIDELKAEEKTYSQKLADLEKQEFTIDNFNKAKMNMIEQSINGRFEIVKFKLFETQINGGETPCCETMVDNVVYSDLNHAMQINAGLDCINALSNYFEVTAPKVIDNAESTNKFIPTSGQLITLSVTKDPQLVVTHL